MGVIRDTKMAEMDMVDLIRWAARRNDCFFLRVKNNGEWETGWGDAAGEATVRADTAMASLRALYVKYHAYPVNSHKR